MKKTLILLLFSALVFSSCKKESNSKPNAALSLVGTKWQSYSFTASDGVTKYYDVLNFKSSGKVDYSQRYPTPSGGTTGYGVAELSYTIDDPTKQFPKITITGKLNSISGTANGGSDVNWVLSYTPELGTVAASMSGTGSTYYMKF